MICAAVLSIVFVACGTDDGHSEPTDETESARSSGSNWSAEMEEIRSAVVDTLGEDYLPNALISAEVLEHSYGIAPDMYEDYLGEMPSTSVNVDTLLIVKAKEGEADAVEEALGAYREQALEENVQYPENLAKTYASRIEAIGNYVCFVQLGGDVEAAAEGGHEEIIAHCLEQNEITLTVLQNTIAHEED